MKPLEDVTGEGRVHTQTGGREGVMRGDTRLLLVH